MPDIWIFAIGCLVLGIALAGLIIGVAYEMR